MKSSYDRLMTPVELFLRLFNPPPLESLTVGQKIGRIFLITVSLTILCIFTAVMLALILYTIHAVPILWSDSKSIGFKHLLAIISASAMVNTLCVLALLQIKKLDRALLDGPD